MKKCAIQNLGMIVTEKCNLDCAHCLRGKKGTSDMSKEVIEATLNQTCAISNLTICGGEPTLALDVIENIITTVIDNKVLLDIFSITINGSIYSEELLRLLDYINDYIKSTFKRNGIVLGVSFDEYHLREIVRLKLLDQYKDNLKKYQESKYFKEYRSIDGKMFREGNAVNLDENLTVPLKPLESVVTYVGNKSKFDRENGLCNIGPLITINPTGLITECNASIENQETKYNYGNVLCDSIEEVCLNNGSEVVEPRKFNKKLAKLIKSYYTYNG